MASFSRRPRRVATASAILVAGAALLWWAPWSHPAAEKADAPVPVVLAQAHAGTLPVELTAIGTVRPRNMVTVRARADGTLVALAFEEGQIVRAGQVIARIDPRPYRAALDQAEAQQAHDEATMANVSVDQARATKLAAIGAGPDQTAKTLTAQLKATRATLAADAAAVAAARLNLSFTTITAPTSGRIGQRLVGIGSVVRSSELTGIATITQIDPIDVQFPITQDRLGEAVAARAAGAPVAILPRDGAAPIATARLDFLDNEVGTETGQIVAKAQVVTGAEHLWPGQLVSARLALGNARGVIVPAAAVQGTGDDSYVYVVDRQGRASLHPVTLALAGPAESVVAAGVADGDHVVIDGQSRLKAGARVTAIAAPARDAAR